MRSAGLSPRACPMGSCRCSSPFRCAPRRPGARWGSHEDTASVLRRAFAGRNPAERRRALKRTIVAAAVVLVALTAAPAAFAHAILTVTSPGNDSIVQHSPPAVLLQFNEAVETQFGSVRVYDCNAKRVDSGSITRPDEKTVSAVINPSLPNGTYTVTWRVISADSHPVSGAFIFHVGSGGKCPAGIASQVLGKGTPGSVNALFKIVRALDFALILLVLGGSAVLVLALRSASVDLRRGLYAILSGLGISLVVAAALCIVLQGAVA